MNKKFEFLKHTGDIKFKAHAKSLEELFENCVLAVSSVFSRGKKIKSEKEREIVVSGKDYESMLYRFIEEIIYLLDAENFVASRAKVNIKNNKIHSIIYGDNSSNYKYLDAIKSPTYSEIYVRKNADGWECQMVLDV